MSEQLYQIQRLQLAGSMAGGIAHDMNNQLTLILGNLELAIERLPESFDAFDMLERAQTAASRCADLSRRLLQIGREKRTKMIPMEVAVAAHEAHQMLECMRPANVQITVECEEALFILGDTTQVQQAVLNLGTNAFHAMPHGGDLAIRTYLEENRVNITVRDTGCGISASLRKRIFEPFFTTHSENGCCGLGLTAVRSIMNAHDGLVGLDSISGKGSTFLLSFPTLKVDQDLDLAA